MMAASWKSILAKFDLNNRRLLLAAVILHMAVTSSIFALGRTAVLPDTFDTNGIAVSFVSDGLKIQDRAARLSDTLGQARFREWLAAPVPFHIKLYSICFALLGPLFGPTILSAEPLNALCYLIVLVLVFQLGREVFGRRSGRIAAVLVALWPSFLLHTTQLLKDPLFLVGMLAFILITLRLLSRSFSLPKALVASGAGGLAAIFIWVERDSMGDIPIITATIGAALLIIKQFRERQFEVANTIGMIMLVVISVGVTRMVPKFRDAGAWREATAKVGQTSASEDPAVSLNPISRAIKRGGDARQRFLEEYPDAGSKLDGEVSFATSADIIRYLPRAAVIGFFAPFPNMWLSAGNQVGSLGRRLSGMETLIMYLLEALAIVGLWSGRQKSSVWFITLVAAAGIILLGLVVANVGAIYRLRFVFLILLFILAAEGILQTRYRFRFLSRQT